MLPGRDMFQGHVAATHILMCADTFSLAQHEFWEKFVPATCRTELNLLNFLGHVTATERYDLRMLGCATCPCGKNQYLSQSETTSSLLCSCALGKNGSCSKSFHRGVRGLASNWNDLDRKRKFLMYRSIRSFELCHLDLISFGPLGQAWWLCIPESGYHWRYCFLCFRLLAVVFQALYHISLHFPWNETLAYESGFYIPRSLAGIIGWIILTGLIYQRGPP